MCRSRPLWNAYLAAGLPSAAELGRLPGVGTRFSAVLSATARFLYPAYLDEASDADLGAALLRFYEAVVDPPLHGDALRRGSAWSATAWAVCCAAATPCR